MDCQAIIFEKLKKIIVEELEVDPDAVTPQASFACDLYCHDELDVVKLVMAVEEEFDIEIPEEVTDCIATVQQAVDYLVIKCSPASEEKRLKEIQARIELTADYWVKLEDISEEEAIDLTKKAFNVIRERHIASKREELDKLRTKLKTVEAEMKSKLKTAETEMKSIKAKIEQCEKDIK
jgi:acyl carrier protein